MGEGVRGGRGGGFRRCTPCRSHLTSTTTSIYEAGEQYTFKTKRRPDKRGRRREGNTTRSRQQFDVLCDEWPVVSPVIEEPEQLPPQPFDSTLNRGTAC